MARAAVVDGIRVVAATPHVRDDYPTAPDEMERGVAELAPALAQAGVELELLPGGELAMERFFRLEAEELRRFGLGGNASWLLLEFPYAGWPLGLPRLAERLTGEGFRLVLAHPERNADVQADPERLRAFVESGILVQLTAASVDGRLGRRPREAASTLLQRGLAHLLASDAHAPSIRAIGLSAAAEAVGDPVLAHWLTEDVPAAIVSGSALPDRPPSTPPARSRRFGRR